MLIEDFNKYINSSLKEVQENLSQQLQACKKETQNSLYKVKYNMGQQAESLKEKTNRNPLNYNMTTWVNR